MEIFFFQNTFEISRISFTIGLYGSGKVFMGAGGLFMGCGCLYMGREGLSTRREVYIGMRGGYVMDGERLYIVAVRLRMHL